MTQATDTEQRTAERWSALGGLLLSALYLWVVLWMLLAVVLPTVGLGWQPAVITSGSMQPLIRPGDIVLSSGAEEVAPGQVITYEDPAQPGTLTTHRVLSVGPDGTIRTQGDANAAADSTPVPVENLVGRGRMLVPLVGLPLVWFSSGLLLFLLWIAVTGISVVVVARGTGTAPGTPVRPTAGGGRVRRGVRWVLRPLAAVRPRRVQRAIVRILVRGARRLHDTVYRGWRPKPSRLRRGTPSILMIGLTLAFARTPATVTAGVAGLVIVLLFDPDGPYIRIGRWERLAVRTFRAVTSAVPAAVASILVVGLLASYGINEVGRSAAAFQDMAGNAGNYFTAAADFPADLTLWLQDAPEDTYTNDAEYSRISPEEPTQTTLYNYDANDDSDPGLRVQKGGADQYEGDFKKVQRWAYSPTSDLTLESAELVFHSAVKNFDPNKAQTVTWYLRHCAGSGSDCVEIAEQTLTSADWQQGAPGFFERTITFGTISHVVPAGRELELVLLVPAGDADMWFAYDTVDYPSRLEVETASPGVCAGPGSSLQHVTGDTQVNQDDPTKNYGGDNELEVTSEAGKNRRTLLTVALPTIPDGCTLTSATVHLDTKHDTLGRTFVVQRTDATVDPSTVTWNTQPTTSGPTSTGPSTPNGPTPIDATAPVQELYAAGNTALQIRDSAEDAASTQDNKFHSLEDRPYPDPEGPRLEVTWGP